MRYPDAKSDFEKMIQLDPKHPAGYIYLGNSIWLNYLADLRRLQSNVYNKSNAFFDTEKQEKANPKIDAEFRKNMNKGVTLAESRLKTNRNDVEAMYFLGVAKNILAGYEATVNRSFFSALRNGSKGVDLHRDLIKKDPAFIDAYLSVGMYDYIVGSLPVAVKILVFFGGVHGSKKKGLATLERVHRDGNYAKDEAAVLLVMLYNREKRLADALQLLDELTKKYPGNSLFALEHAMTLAQLRRFVQSQEAFEQIMQNQHAMSYMSDVIYYQYAEALFAAGDWDTAAARYADSANSPKAKPAMKTLAILNEGRCLDAQGKRDLALKRYGEVLKRPDVFNSHKSAKTLQKTPFKP
jgi:tetratricopeptide (TPR) repeat protein